MVVVVKVREYLLDKFVEFVVVSCLLGSNKSIPYRWDSVTNSNLGFKGGLEDKKKACNSR